MNQDKLGAFFIQQQVKLILEKWAIPLLASCLVVFLVFQTVTTYSMYASYEAALSNRNAAQESLNIYRRNVMLAKDERDYYGAILARHIPVKENVFQTYTFIDEFVAKSGLTVSQSGASEKPVPKSEAVNSMVLTVSGTVPEKDFDKFLQDYQFAFSRFMTMSSMKRSFAPDGGEIAFTTTLNLYTIPAVEDLGKDLVGMKLLSFDGTILKAYEKIRVELRDENYVEKQETEEDISVDYDTKGTLF